MKLYATVSSERATKGQGGNKYLDIDILNERKEPIARFEVRNSQYPNTEVDILYWVHNPSVSFGEMDYAGTEKGKQQKGDRGCCIPGCLSTAILGDYCKVHAQDIPL